MNKWLLRGILGVFVLWLLAALWLAPGVEASLEKHARAALDAPEFRGAFSQVEVNFFGQEAALTGSVGDEEARVLAANVIANQLRTSGELGAGLNPVTAVVNNIDVQTAWNEAHPLQRLFVTFYGSGTRVELSGLVKLGERSGEAEKAMAAKMSDLTHDNTTVLRTAARPVVNWEETLKTLPDLRGVEGAAKTGALAFSSIDGRWTMLPGKATEADAEKAAVGTGVAVEQVLSALGHLHAWTAREEQKVKDQIAAEKRAADLKIAEAKLAQEKEAMEKAIAEKAAKAAAEKAAAEKAAAAAAAAVPAAPPAVPAPAPAPPK